MKFFLKFSPHLRRCRYRDGNGGTSAASGGQRLGAGPSHHHQQQQQQQQQPQQHSPGNSGANNGSGGGSSNNNNGGNNGQQQLAAQSVAVAAAAAAAAAALHSSHHNNPGMVLDLSQVRFWATSLEYHPTHTNVFASFILSRLCVVANWSIRRFCAILSPSTDSKSNVGQSYGASFLHNYFYPLFLA